MNNALPSPCQTAGRSSYDAIIIIPTESIRPVCRGRGCWSALWFRSGQYCLSLHGKKYTTEASIHIIAPSLFWINIFKINSLISKPEAFSRPAAGGYFSIGNYIKSRKLSILLRWSTHPYAAKTRLHHRLMPCTVALFIIQGCRKIIFPGSFQRPYPYRLSQTPYMEGLL